MTVLDAKTRPWDPRNIKAVVYLDGVKQEDAVYADDELGILERYQRDAFGNAVTTPTDWVTETLHGEVRIEFYE